MSTAPYIAKSLNGAPSGSGWLCRCPCAGHGKGRGDRHPSLSIADGDEALLVRCFGGCDARVILAELRHRGLLNDDGMSRRRDVFETSRQRDVVATEPNPEAQRLWRSAAVGTGTLVQNYLETRGINSVPPSLRYVTTEYIAGRVYMPAMLAAIQAPDRSIAAVQYTCLRHDGSGKAPVATPRRTMGMLGAGAVRLAAAAPVMGIAEGIETALAAQQVTGVPCWASLGAARMHRVWVPDETVELHVFADADAPGLAAAERVAAAHAHRRVIIRVAPVGCGDWADALAKKAVAA